MCFLLPDLRAVSVTSVTLVASLALLAACGSTTPAPYQQPPATYLDAVDGVTEGNDAGTTDDASAVADVGTIDTGTTAQPEDAGAPDLGGFDPDDTNASTEDAVAKPVGAMLFAHTKDTLYALDPDKLAMVAMGPFTFDKKKGLVTDIALDQFRNLWAITFTDLFSCNADTAKCKWVAKLPQEFNGLTFIPESLVPGSKQEALIGISEKGDWNWIQPDKKGGVTIKKLGTYGSGWLSSGDAFSVVGVGTFATLKKKSGGIDSLASVDPKTGKLLKVIGSTGAKGLFGFAWWADVFYGFSVEGKVWEIDVKTGKATETATITVPTGVKWWGAGVSTRANGP